MADSVVKLRVDSNEYDAKIKRAADGLRAFGENCRKAGESVTKADKNTLDYVRSIGQMETVSKTAKGKVNEMSSAFTELSVQYRKLTNEEKQSTFGQALSQSLEQLKARIKDTKEELSEINNELGKTQNAPVSMPGGNLLGGGKLDGMLQVFGGNVMTKAAMWATGLAADMADCVKQGIELAKAGEGIRLAFDRLNRPDLLDKLREATHGTVTDLELMKQAVKFNDFNLSLDEMGTMLAFAQQKAKDTGQSVDYMVDSIVTGLGRKSLMILDNLGLSASEIKDKMAETGDMTKAVGAIIRDQMSKAGDYVETTADRAARADAELKNAMEELGRTFQPLAETGAAMFQSLEIGALNLLNRAIQPLIDKFTTLGRLRREYANAGGSSRVGTDIERLQKNSSSSAYKVILSQYDREIEDRERAIKAWNAWRKGDRSSKAESEMQWAKSKYGTDTGDMRAQLNAWQKMRGEFVEQSKAVMNPVKVTVDTKDAITGVDSLKGKLKELEEQRKKAIKAGDHDQVKNLTQQINQVKGDIKGLDPNAFKVNRHKITTHKITPQEKAADIVSDAERTYTETILKNSIRLEAGIDTTLENKKKELSAQERLFDAYSDAYATYKDPKYKESINDAADKMKSLAKEVKETEDAQKAAKEAAKREAEMVKRMVVGQSGFNADTMDAWMKGRQGDLAKAEYGSADYKDITANIADMTAIKTVLEQSVKAGIDASQFDLEPLWEKIFDGENIPDDTWSKMIEVINKKLKDLDLDPITLDVRTGNLASKTKGPKGWEGGDKAAAVLGQINGGLNSITGGIKQLGIDVPDGIERMITTLQVVQSILTGISSIVLTISMLTAAKSVPVVGAFLSTGGIAHAAGGLLTGHHYSGDQVPVMVNDGELILNRAQQGVIADGLRGGDVPVIQIEGVIDGENLRLVQRNSNRRRGRGEYVTSKNR